MGGPGGGFGPGGQEKKLLAAHDKDKNGRLDAAERKAAREALKKEPRQGRGMGPGGGMGRGPMGGEQKAPEPGAKVAVADAKSYPDAKLFDTTVLRTLFIDFEDKDWEAEMSEFYNSDVDVPANLTVDGKKYPGIGVHFRGASSFFTVGAGLKRSMNIAIDHTDEKQRLYGAKTLNLLNAHEDPTFMHTVLYSMITRQYVPAPQANFVKVVINGENWGIYTSAQQFDKAFVGENFPVTKGTRWKTPGSPRGSAGLQYLGEDVEPYKQRFEIKSDDNPKAWKALIHLTKVLNETPIDQLEEALNPILDIDGALGFLAAEVALVNNDGYWTRASDYSIFLDDKGIFHIMPHDMNETFSSGGGGFGPPGGGFGPPGGGPGFGPPEGGEGRRRPPEGDGREAGEGRGGPPPQEGGEGRRRGGMGGGMGGGMRLGGIDLDPLVGLDDQSKPLRSKLLAVPALRDRYLAKVREIAEVWLDWKKLGPIVADLEKLIGQEIAADTKKLSTTEEFKNSLTAPAPEAPKPAEGEDGQRPRGRRGPMSLKAFAEKRREFLLSHPSMKKQ